jgi:hypothetical protein
MMSDETTANADTGTDAPNLTSGADTANANAANTNTDTNNNQETAKSFAQADINRIVARESKKAVEAALKAETDKKAQAEMTESQREKTAREAAEKKAEEAEARATNVLKRNAVTLGVADPKLGARDPKALALLVNMDALEVDGDNVTGVDDELKRLRKTYPALFFKSTADGGERDTGNSAPSTPNERLRNAYVGSTK